MKKTLSATDVRKNFFQLIKTTERPGSTLTITVEGEAKIVMMPVEDFEGWQETLEIMSDKKLLKNIQAALKSKKRYSEAEIKKELNFED
ncbi:hypothetical protein COV82_01145 [Candidatus Peregrinibacteria bacterium CG11_big_fil_rev_8_21_14_0_20_46_8]|nr:MAG: hypothetical protein COV82_01145 [Candidatus Peregrinibacteria bacterium CG11_big_fil_rev_8_21_14_0_20_46_8]